MTTCSFLLSFLSPKVFLHVVPSLKVRDLADVESLERIRTSRCTAAMKGESSEAGDTTCVVCNAQ